MSANECGLSILSSLAPTCALRSCPDSLCVFRFKCGLAGKRYSPVDGQWFSVNTGNTDTVPAHQKAHSSIHFKLLRNRSQWNFRSQLQQDLDAYPDIVDWLARMHNRNLAISQLKQNQSTPEPQHHHPWHMLADSVDGSVKEKKVLHEAA